MNPNPTPPRITRPPMNTCSLQRKFRALNRVSINGSPFSIQRHCSSRNSPETSVWVASIAPAYHHQPTRAPLPAGLQTRSGALCEVDCCDTIACLQKRGRKMPNGTKRWTIEIDKARFDKLKSEERFWQLVALARAVNTMRFVQTALLAQAEESDSLQAKRTKFNSFFFTCALLYEAIRLVERMGKYFHQVPAFGPLHEILKDPTATELRNSNLNPLRNQLTFHFFEKEIGAQLIKNDANPR